MPVRTSNYIPADTSSEFDISNDETGLLEIRAGSKEGFHYFFHRGDNRLIKHFLLERGRQVSTLCEVTLIKKKDVFEPRVRLWKRDNRTKRPAEKDIAAKSADTRHIRASVSTDSCHEAFWKLIQFLATFSGVSLPDNNFRVAEGVDASLLDALRQGRIEPTKVRALADAIGASKESRQAFASTDAGEAVARMVRHQQQIDVLNKLDAIVRNSSTTEPDVHKLLTGQYWLFGGRFIGEANRRALTVTTQLDIPLLRSDGTLHVVELKSPVIPKLLRMHRKKLIVGYEVSEAVGQVANYLVELDEQRDTIKTKLGIDVRRAFATIVIGHSKHARHSAEAISGTFRIFGSHLARIDIMTYEELIDGARRALSLDNEAET